jgi:ligand-binding sensor domain-containing protein
MWYWDVIEDRTGNLWFGTRNSGVYRYDGASFQHFTTHNGLANNASLFLYEDRAGHIWTSASRYDGTSWQALSTKDGYPSNQIRLLLEDRAGRRWFCAQQEDLFVQDGNTCTVLKNSDGKAFNNVWSVVEDKKGYFWFSGTEGLGRYDGKTFTLVSKQGASSILEDTKGNIWVAGGVSPPYGSDWALRRYDAKSLYDKEPTFTEIMVKDDALLALLEDRNGHIWIGAGRGVYRYDGKRITDFKSVKE